MLRQVLTPTELAELGLDAAAHTLPQPSANLTFRSFIKSRRFLTFTFLAMWFLILFNISSCFAEIKVQFDLFEIIATKLILINGAVLLFLCVTEIIIGLNVLQEASRTIWDFVGLCLGLGNRIVLIFDTLLPVVAWHQGYMTTSLITSVTCLIVYIGLLGIQQSRMLLSLYSFKDSYMVQNLNQFFFCDALKYKQVVTCLPLKLLWGHFTRKSRASARNVSIEMFDTVEKETATQSEIYKSTYPFNTRKLISAADSISSSETKQLNENKKKLLPTPAMPSSISRSHDNEQQNNHFSDLISSNLGSDFDLGVVNSELENPSSLVSDTNESLLYEPPQNGDPFIYTIGYSSTILMFRLFYEVKVCVSCFFTASRRFFSVRPLFRSVGPVTPSARNQQSLSLLLPLRNQISSDAAFIRAAPTPFSTVEAWLFNLKEQENLLVADTKVTQLANTSFLTDCYFLQNVIRRIYLAPDCLEVHEFSTAFTSLGRCFMGEVILNLFKCYLLISQGLSLFLMVSLIISMFQNLTICLYNTIDGEFWQDVLTVE